MRFLALLKPFLSGTSAARVLLAVAASTAVTAGVATPMAHQAYAARAEQSAAAMLAVDDTVPNTTVPLAGPADRATTQPDPTVPPIAPSTVPPSTTPPETDPGATPQSIVVTPTTISPTTVLAPADSSQIAPPRTTTTTSAPTPTPTPTVPPPTIARPTTTIRTVDTIAPTTTSTTSTSTTSTTSTSTSTTSTSTSTTSTSTTTTIPTTSDSIYVSTQPDRSDPELLDGETVWGDIYVFVDWPGASVVRFYIDNTERTGSPDRVESHYPFDLGATAPSGSAFAFDSSTLGSGSHSITVEVVDNGVNVRTATFTVT